MIEQYEQLKAEQRTRIEIRDRLVYATFTALGGSIVLSGSTAIGHQLLLGMPLVCYALGWTYLRNNRKINEIAAFVRTRYPEYDWEVYRLETNGRCRRKIIQLSVNLTMFVATGCIALWALWLRSGLGPATLTFSVLDSLVLAILAIEFIRSADIVRRSQ